MATFFPDGRPGIQPAVGAGPGAHGSVTGHCASKYRSEGGTVVAGAADPALALRDLRRARHHRHREDFDWVETLYRVYVTVLSGAALIWPTPIAIMPAPPAVGVWLSEPISNLPGTEKRSRFT